MSEWQPISSYRGGVVLVWFGRIGMSYNVMFQNSSGEWVEAVDDGRCLKDGYEPTHWMPLPPPPMGE